MPATLGSGRPMQYAIDDATAMAREKLHLACVQSDFQSLQAHMANCARSRRRWAQALHGPGEALCSLMLKRIVASVMCGALLGLGVGSMFSWIFPA